MQVVVPMAGEGTRLRPLTAETPKGLVDVAGQPLLHHVLEGLPRAKVSGITLIVGRDGQAVVDRFGHRWRSLPITYAEQRQPRGLADAVLAAAAHLDEAFAVLNGDNVHRSNLEAVIDHHREHRPAATLLVEPVSRAVAESTGVLRLDEDGDVVGVVERADEPPSQLAMAGFGVFSPALLDACRLVTPSDRGERELADAITLLAWAGRRIERVRLAGWRCNVNTPADLEAVADRLSGA